MNKIIIICLTIFTWLSCHSQNIVYVSDQNSPRLKSYQDSLQIYNSWQSKFSELNSNSIRMEKEYYNRESYLFKFAHLYDEGKIERYSDKHMINNQIISNQIIPLGCDVFHISKDEKNCDKCSCSRSKTKEVHMFNYSNVNPTQQVIFRNIVPTPVVLASTKPKTKQVYKKLQPKFESDLFCKRKDIIETGIGTVVPKVSELKSDDFSYVKPAFTTIDKTTMFYVKSDGKTVVPYIQKTLYDTANHIIGVQHLDPKTNLEIR